VPRRRITAGAGLVAVGAATVLVAAGGGQVGLTGPGAVLVVVGMVVFGPVAARAGAAGLGAPIAALRGITGAWARQNASRNPRRTAATASAPMIGVTVVALFTVVGASLKASAAHGVNQTLRADLIVDVGGYGGQSGASGLSSHLARRLSGLPAVQTTAPIANGTAVLDGHARSLSIADPAVLTRVADPGTVRGSIAGLDAGTLAVSRAVAKDRHWRLGTVVPITYPDGADRATTDGRDLRSP
jgi:putative ABC transport system permease protein